MAVTSHMPSQAAPRSGVRRQTDVLKQALKAQGLSSAHDVAQLRAALTRLQADYQRAIVMVARLRKEHFAADRAARNAVHDAKMVTGAFRVSRRLAACMHNANTAAVRHPTPPSRLCATSAGTQL